MKRVLFACVGNAMRSQMAEGLARALAQPGALDVRSGGTDPAGFVHPDAIRLMKERGVDIARHTSKRIDLEFAKTADAVITLCGPLDDACPRTVAEQAVDWSLPDPSWGGDNEVREVRDELERRIRRLLGEWGILKGEAVARS